MVIKLWKYEAVDAIKFESSVISYGNQTGQRSSDTSYQFESSVISYGNQTEETIL